MRVAGATIVRTSQCSLNGRYGCRPVGVVGLEAAARLAHESVGRPDSPRHRVCVVSALQRRQLHPNAVHIQAVHSIDLLLMEVDLCRSIQENNSRAQVGPLHKKRHLQGHAITRVCWIRNPRLQQPLQHDYKPNKKLQFVQLRTLMQFNACQVKGLILRPAPSLV